MKTKTLTADMVRRQPGMAPTASSMMEKKK